jgi:hypothetical protein
MAKGTCSESGCNRPVLARGQCSPHYQRWRRTRPAERACGEGHGRWTGDEASYSAVHGRLVRTRGRASSFACAHCGESARQWAYDYGDPNERHDQQCGAYSVDLDRYMPLCVPCHTRFDCAHRLSGEVSCPRGLHPYPENLFFAGKRKERRCRKCEAARKRSLYHRQR